MRERQMKSAKRYLALLLAAFLLVSVSGCGSAGGGRAAEGTMQEEARNGGTDAETEPVSGSGEEPVSGSDAESDGNAESGTASETSSDRGGAAGEGAPELPGLAFESRLELMYAQAFDVYRYTDGYSLIDVHDSARYLVVPEGKSAPEGLSEDIVVLKQPFGRIYLAATSAMSLFDALDSLDKIRMTGTRESGWYIDNAVKAMESGDIIFAGKYSEPDYELLINEGCDLAVESTMIFHTPKVKEMIEELGIPVFIDRSTYEKHPLGRTEWIKLYGVLAGKEAEADAFFEEQTEIISELRDFPNTGKRVVYFYMNTNGSAVVRRADDYIPGMIQLAGGTYAFPDLIGEEYNSASVSLSMEEFYATAVDADYLVYNAAIDSPIGSLDELLAKSELFADFKAVKEGNVWTTGKSLYQATDIVGEMIRDLNLMLTDGNEEDMTFLTRVK